MAPSPVGQRLAEDDDEEVEPEDLSSARPLRRRQSIQETSVLHVEHHRCHGNVRSLSWILIAELYDNAVHSFIHSFVHLFILDLYGAPSRNLLPLATVKEKRFKKLVERRHIGPRQQAQRNSESIPRGRLVTQFQRRLDVV